MEEVSFEFVVWWKDHPAFVFPEAYGWFHGGFDEFKLVVVVPFFHELFLLLLFSLFSLF